MLRTITVLLLATFAAVQGQLDCVCLEEVEAAENLVFPTVVRFNDGRMFVSEQTGATYIIKDNVRQPEPFLDISDWLIFGGEQGFLSMAFHPQHATNSLIYVYYSIMLDGQECSVGDYTGIRHTRLSEMSLSDPDHVDRDTERVLLDICQPFTNHNGGDLLFDDDGYLLVFVGDGGSGGDPYNLALNKGSLLGKALRIDVDSRDDGLEYGIPPDNPYLDDEDALPELYAIGLRNPWRVSRDMGHPFTGENEGRVFIGDVGQVRFEEVDILKRGANYGWAAYEARECYDQELCDKYEDEELEWPLHYYPRSVGRCIIGGYVYRGIEFPDMQGWYIFGDYMDGKLFRMLDGEGDEYWPVEEIFTCPQFLCPEGTSNDFLPRILTFGQDPYGDVYFTAVNFFGALGKMYRIIDPFEFPRK